MVDPSLAFQAGCVGLLQLIPGALRERVTVAAATDQPFMIGTEGLEEALVCPCMDVTAGEVLRRIADGETDPEELKRATSCGMGPCRGVPCWAAMVALIDSQTAQHDAAGIPQDRRPSFRPPGRVITVAQAAGLHGLVDPDR